MVLLAEIFFIVFALAGFSGGQRALVPINCEVSLVKSFSLRSLFRVAFYGGKRRTQKTEGGSVDCRGAAYSGCSCKFPLSLGLKYLVRMISFFHDDNNELPS